MAKTSRTQSFGNYDLLGRLLRGGLKLSPIKTYLLLLALNIVVDFAAAWAFHAVVNPGYPPGLLNDTPALFVDFIMMPVICAYFVWTIPGAEALFQDLHDSGVLTRNSSLDAARREMDKKLGSKWMFAAAIVLAALVTGLLVATSLDNQHSNPGWLLNSPLLPWLRVPFWFVGMYALCFALFNIAVTIVSLRKLFTDTSVELSPWHPDRCGGLRGINRYSLNLSYAIAIIGLVLSTLILREAQSGTLATYYLGWIGVAAYLVIAPLLFFLPLGTAHAAMRRARDKYLLMLAEEFDLEYGFSSDHVEKDPKKLKLKVEKIQQLKELYKTTEEFPVWPFDIASLRRFLAITSAPLLPGIVSLAVEVIKVLLTK